MGGVSFRLPRRWHAHRPFIKDHILALHLPLFASAALLSMALSALPAQAKDSHIGFQVCDAEGAMALHMARNYIMSGKKRESVLKHVGEDAQGMAMANALFSKVDSGEIKHHAQFAAESLLACAQREQLALNKSVGQTRVCYARVDMPFYLHLAKEQGLDKAAAIQKVSGQLSERTLYPSELISLLAERIYPDAAFEQTRKLMGTVFWSCMFNQEWTAKAAHPAAAPAPASK